MKAKVELLAPAGSFETMKAVIAAGADAVYMGGPMYGARAYADNPDTEKYLEAIDYAHLRGVKLYMTVNTLLKEDEINESLYDYILPFYERGLDAVIVQDLGVLRFLRKCFPDLTIHISTQMTCTGELSAEYFKELGAERVVPARELNLKELKKICDTGIEVECFVHGAICYCYSGKCLFSSLAGGRSGNRGRCAQPCRQAYSLFDQEGNRLNSKKETYLLSLKDMNTLDILPEIIDCGVYSLKIEGRMKKAEYAAGVVSIYRKYLDKILNGEKYAVETEDAKKLWDLFNRNGFNSGYFKQKNGKDMMSLTETEFRAHDDAWIENIRQQYINTETKVPISFNAYFKAGESIVTTAGVGDLSVLKSFDVPQLAVKSATTLEQVNKQLNKTGGTDFEIEDLYTELDDNLFLPVSELNNIRRETLSTLREEILVDFKKNSSKRYYTEASSDNEVYRFTAKAESLAQLKACIDYGRLSRIYVDAGLLFDRDCDKLIKACKEEVFLAVKEPFRLEDKIYYNDNIERIRDVFDGVLCDSIESFCYFSAKGKFRIVADQGLYSWNSWSCEQLQEMGAESLTAPYELNLKELLRRGMKDTELVIYGYLPMMTTAGCVWKNSVGCRKTEGVSCICGCLVDSQKRSFPVKTDCNRCGNTIYNCVPLSLDEKVYDRLKPALCRYQFTFEGYEDTLRVLETGTAVGDNVTRGHIKRGVE